MRLVGALAGLIERGRQLRGAWLLLVALGGLVEMRTQAVDAGGARGERLLVLRLGNALGNLLRVTLALWNALLAFYGLVSLRAVVVYCQRLLVSRTRTRLDARPHSPDGFGDSWPGVESADGCERFDFLENIEGIAGSVGRGAAGWRGRGGDSAAMRAS